MAHSTMETVRRYLRRFEQDEASDEVLLRRFIAEGDEEAFARLVRRHGPMVLGTSRRITGGSEAEDVLQATFLTLARDARSIRNPATLASWLHRVAYRTARRSRISSEPLKQIAVPEAQPHDPAERIMWRELREALDEELDRLAEDLRAPLVLCYLEGLTRDEAAAVLGWSLGTLKRRLAEGRKRLRERLEARGAIPFGLALAAILPPTLQAELPADLARNILAQSTPISPTEPTGAMMTSSFSKRMMVLSLTLFGGLLLGGWLLLSSAAEPMGEAKRVPNRPAPREGAEKKGPPVDDFGDPLPPGALRRFGTVRYRHGGGFNDAILSPDGKLLLATSEVGMTIFEMETGRPILKRRTMEIPNGHATGCRKFDFSPDGKLFVHLHHDRSVRLRKVSDGSEVAQLVKPALPIRWGGIPRPGAAPQPQVQAIWAKSVYFLSEKEVLIVGQNGAVLLVSPDGATRKEVSVRGSEVGVCPNGKLAYGLSAGKAHVHELPSGKLIQELDVEGNLRIGAFSPNGRILSVANQAGRIHIMDVKTGKTLATPQIPKPERRSTDLVTSMVVSRDGKTLFAGDRNGGIHRWSLITFKELPRLSGHRGRSTSLMMHPDGKTLISAGWDAMVRRWDVATGKETPPTPGYIDSASARISPQGDVVAVGDESGKLDLYDLRTGKGPRALLEKGPRVVRVTFSPTGRFLATGLSDGRVIVWNVRARKKEASLKVSQENKPPHGYWFREIAFTPDEAGLLTSSAEDKTRLWDWKSGKERWSQPFGGRAAFSPDGQVLVTGGWNEQLQFRDPQTGTIRFAITDHGGKKLDTIDDITFSPDGKLLATCHHNGLIRLYHPKTGEPQRSFSATSDVVWEVSFSQDGKWIFAAGSDHHVYVVEVCSGQVVLKLEGHDGRVYKGQMCPDGKTALSSAWDGTALLWSLRPADRPSFEEPDRIWEDLRSEDAARSYRAVWAMIDAPERAVELLASKVKIREVKLDEERIRALIRQLDAKRFRDREAASKALGEAGPLVVLLLKKALAKAESVELRKRLRALVEGYQKPVGPEEWRILRAVRALELGKSPEAKRLLERWAKGGSDALLSEEARAALNRWSSP